MLCQRNWVSIVLVLASVCIVCLSTLLVLARNMLSLYVTPYRPLSTACSFDQQQQIFLGDSHLIRVDNYSFIVRRSCGAYWNGTFVSHTHNVIGFFTRTTHLPLVYNNPCVLLYPMSSVIQHSQRTIYQNKPSADRALDYFLSDGERVGNPILINLTCSSWLEKLIISTKTYFLWFYLTLA